MPDINICISSFTYGEPCRGFEKNPAKERNQLTLTLFLYSLRILPFDGSATQVYVSGEKVTPIGPLDTLIAAHSESLGMALVIKNTIEFKRIEKLTI